MARISRVDDNLVQLNKELAKIDDLHKQIADLKQQFASVHKKVTELAVKHAPATLNNALFTWTGATTTISWPAGSVLDRQDINVPIVAGSITGLTPSTHYWLAWNPVHKRMVAQVGVNGLLQNKDNLVLCQVLTGDAGTTGVAGGGKSSSSGSDLSGARYELL